MPILYPVLDVLLDPHDHTLFVGETGHLAKFIARQAEVTSERPHGLRYSLTVHTPEGTRFVGFDNS